jgi:hypothetical protein
MVGLNSQRGGKNSGGVQTKGIKMGIVIIAALLVLLFFGLGFALHLLWIVAVILLVLWLAGFAVGRGESSGRRGWYGR